MVRETKGKAMPERNKGSPHQASKISTGLGFLLLCFHPSVLGSGPKQTPNFSVLSVLVWATSLAGFVPSGKCPQILGPEHSPAT
jgi:hypothetical protein